MVPAVRGAAPSTGNEGRGNRCASPLDDVFLTNSSAPLPGKTTHFIKLQNYSFIMVTGGGRPLLQVIKELGNKCASPPVDVFLTRSLYLQPISLVSDRIIPTSW